MFRALCSITLSALVLFSAACETRPVDDADDPDAVEGDTLAMADEATVRESIEATNQRFEEALLASDTTAVEGLYTDDAVALPPNMPRVTGPGAIGSMWAGMIVEGGLESVALATDEVTVAESGELAFETGSYSVAGTTPDGLEWQEEGKYLVVWENVDGTWLLAADMWSSDAPPPGMEAAGEAAGAGTATMGADSAM